MPTLSSPVFDTGGIGAATRPSSARKPLTIVLVFLGALVVTVVALRLILGPFGGAEPTDGGSSTSAEQPSTTGGAASAPPPATVTRPAGVQETPDGLVRQFVLEFFTRRPGESPAQVGERLQDLLSPGYAYGLASDTNGAGRPGSLVEVGRASAIDPDIFEMEVRPWTYGSDDAATEAVPADPQVWRVAVREYLGLWTVTAAQVV